MLGIAVRTSLRHRAAVLAIAAGLTLLGFLAALTIDIDVLPDISRPTLTIMTEAPGLATEEVESRVTQPLEWALGGLPSMIRMRSTSAAGLSILNLELGWNADAAAARQQASERLGAARAQLPAGVVPQIQPISSIMGEVMLVAITSDGQSGAMALRELADWTVRPRLLAIPGVSQVIPIGGEVRQLRVAPQPALMAGLDIAAADIERALSRFGMSAGAGQVNQGGSEFAIRTVASADADALGAIVIAVRKGVPILLRQVARVGFDAQPSRGSAGVDGRDAVIVSVQKQPNADTGSLNRAVVAALAELQQAAPAGVRVDRVVFNQAGFIAVAIRNVSRALVESLLVVGLVLFVFLGNVRTTLISLLAIPLSVLAAVVAFRAFGIGVNTMTLGGLAIAMGELVDDAVVGVENVFRRLRQNRAAAAPRPVLAIVAEASEEVRSGILVATAVIVVMLLPLFAIPGVEGRLLAPLALAYLTALAASLVVAVTVTPVLCALLLPRMRNRVVGDTALMRVLKAALERWLPSCLRHRNAVMAAAAAGVAIAAVLFAVLPRALMPSFNEGALTVELSGAPGMTLADSTRLGAVAERLLLEVDGIATVGRRTGRAELDEHAQGVQTTELDLTLEPSARPRTDIVRDIRARLAILPVSVNIGQPIAHRIDHLLSGVRAQIVLKVFGDDLDAASALAERLRGDLARIGGLVDLQVERRPRIPTIEIRADERRAAPHGTTSAAVAETVTALAGGRTLSQIVDGARRYDLVLRLDDRDRTSAGLAHLLIETPSGRVPAGSLAQVVEAEGQYQVERENGRRRVAVYANVGTGDLARTIADIRTVIAAQPVPAGYAITLEGAFAAQDAAVVRVTALGTLAIAAVFLLLLARYRSVALALIVMASVPLAMIGGVAALALAGLPLSLASVVGFITLAGISLRNGILKVSHYVNLALHELPFGETLILRGSLERLTPVLMTAAAASFALLPLIADADAAGKEILYPVAVVVFGGLITATLLDTVVTPVLFGRFGAAALARLARTADAQSTTF